MLKVMEADGPIHPKPRTENENLTFVFKAPKEDDHTYDKYQEILTTNNIPAIVIPVLTFDFVNIAELAASLSSPESLSGIIFTSTRSVQALSIALKGLPNHQDQLRLLQCFSVGPATQKAADALGFNSEGKDAGNGDALASYILENIKDSSKPLLYPCSSMHRENVPKMLRDKGLTIKEIVSYETHPDEHIEEHIKMAVNTKGVPQYAVFFSPSGFNSVNNNSSSVPFSLANTKIIALGPTTAAAVTDMGYELHGMTKKPDPESLLALLQKSISGQI